MVDQKTKYLLPINPSFENIGQTTAGWDNNDKPGNQVSTKSLPSSEIFGQIPVFIIIYVRLVY